MSAARDDFLWTDQAEPHAARRAQILQAHPEVKRLMGPEWRSKYLAALRELFEKWKGPCGYPDTTLRFV